MHIFGQKSSSELFESLMILYGGFSLFRSKSSSLVKKLVSSGIISKLRSELSYLVSKWCETLLQLHQGAWKLIGRLYCPEEEIGRYLVPVDYSRSDYRSRFLASLSCELNFRLAHHAKRQKSLHGSRTRGMNDCLSPNAVCKNENSVSWQRIQRYPKVVGPTSSPCCNPFIGLRALKYCRNFRQSSVVPVLSYWI
jgi:hypothetical protein